MRPEVRMAVRIDPFPAPSFKSADQESGAAESGPVWLTMCEAARRVNGYPQASINVAGIRAVRQRLEPSLYCLSIDPLCEG